MKAFERLLKYAAVRTPSDEESDTVPSSACQFELAHHLYRELFTMGITDVKVDTRCCHSRHAGLRRPAEAGIHRSSGHSIRLLRPADHPGDS